MGRLRIGLLTLLVLAVPPFALGGQQAPSGPGALTVSASLEGCGLAETAIVCRIDVSWNEIEGADHYAVSVTRPDGSILDLGQGVGAGRTAYVPYVGAGSYSVQVVAWGTAPGEDEGSNPWALDRDRVKPRGNANPPVRPPSEPEQAAAERPAPEPGDQEPSELGPGAPAVSGPPGEADAADADEAATPAVRSGACQPQQRQSCPPKPGSS